MELAFSAPSTQAWTSAEAALPLDWKLSGLYRFDDLWESAWLEGPEFDYYASGSGQFAEQALGQLHRPTAGATRVSERIIVFTKGALALLAGLVVTVLPFPWVPTPRRPATRCSASSSLRGRAGVGCRISGGCAHSRGLVVARPAAPADDGLMGEYVGTGLFWFTLSLLNAGLAQSTRTSLGFCMPCMLSEATDTSCRRR